MPPTATGQQAQPFAVATVPTVPPTVTGSATVPTVTGNRQPRRRSRVRRGDLPTGQPCRQAQPFAVRHADRFGNRGDSLPQPFAVATVPTVTGSPWRSSDRATGNRRNRPASDLPTATGRQVRAGDRFGDGHGFGRGRATVRRRAAKRATTARPCVPAVRTGSRPPRFTAAPCAVPVRRGDGQGNGATADRFAASRFPRPVSTVPPTATGFERSRPADSHADGFAPNAPQPPALAFPPFGRVSPPSRSAAAPSGVPVRRGDGATGRQVRTGQPPTGSDNRRARSADGDRRNRPASDLPTVPADGQGDGQPPTGSGRSDLPTVKATGQPRRQVRAKRATTARPCVPAVRTGSPRPDLPPRPVPFLCRSRAPWRDSVRTGQPPTGSGNRRARSADGDRRNRGDSLPQPCRRSRPADGDGFGR